MPVKDPPTVVLVLAARVLEIVKLSEYPPVITVASIPDANVRRADCTSMTASRVLVTAKVNSDEIDATLAFENESRLTVGADTLTTVPLMVTSPAAAANELVRNVRFGSKQVAPLTSPVPRLATS